MDADELLRIIQQSRRSRLKLWDNRVTGGIPLAHAIDCLCELCRKGKIKGFAGSRAIERGQGHIQVIF